jgi:hypothetical protein
LPELMRFVEQYEFDEALKALETLAVQWAIPLEEVT